MMLTYYVLLYHEYFLTMTRVWASSGFVKRLYEHPRPPHYYLENEVGKRGQTFIPLLLTCLH